MNDQQLIVQHPQELALVDGMIQQIISGDMTEQKLVAMQKLIDMKEHQEERQARSEYNLARSQMQAELPIIDKTTIVPTKAGGKKYDYAKYEDMMPVLQPFLTRYGFYVRFDQEIVGDRLHVLCYLPHKNGHCEPPTRFSVPLDAAGPKDTSAAQATAANSTAAKRHALMNALNIVTRGMDNDARALGSDIAPEVAAELFTRANAIYPVERFEKWHRDVLEFAGVDVSAEEPVSEADYRRIQTGRLKEVQDFLATTEARKGKK